MSLNVAPSPNSPASMNKTYDVSIVLPSYNEEGNVPEMISRLTDTFSSLNMSVEVLYVDDGKDSTVQTVRNEALKSPLSVFAHHRDNPVGGLSGAVIEGIQRTHGDIVVVMDADLQHPPEVIPLMISKLQNHDICVASRYIDGGDSGGLDGFLRTAASRISTLAVRTLFPRRLAHCSDPMTGFFAFRRASIKTDVLRPRGFKILLEILALHKLSVTEIPFSFAERTEGESKASMKQGVEFAKQLISLRLLRWQAPAITVLAVIGAIGTLLSLALMQLFMTVGMDYVLASIIASEITIGTNLYMQEKWVFHKRENKRSLLQRSLLWYGFGNIEMIVRTPFLILLVSGLGLNAVIGQAILLVGFFILRYFLSSRILYGRKKI